MASENETVDDILKELRGIKGGQHTNGGLSFERWRARCQFADDYADRFESAWRREKAELCECLKFARRDLCKACKKIGFKCKRSEPCCTVVNIDIALHKALEGANAQVAEGGES